MTNGIVVDHELDVDGGDKHNRWHPHIRPTVKLTSGQTVRMRTRDAVDGQLRPGTTVADFGGMELGRVHPLTGPIHVEDAEPGDLLAVHILHVEPAERGFTATFPGRGFLPDLFPGPLLTHWQISDGYATSEQIPGVRIRGASFMGTIGVAPSLERLRTINARERAAAQAGALVMAPRSLGAIPDDPAISEEALRTAAAHEVGGNMDIRQLGDGAVVYFPVDVQGALFSAGDAHFAQGEGETCGTAIEMDSVFTARLELIKGAAAERGQTGPTFACGVDRQHSPGERFFATTGISVYPNGTISPMDASLAARNALDAMVTALAFDRGLTREQAYTVASVAGELRISSIVNVPHAQVSMFVPQSIFVG